MRVWPPEFIVLMGLEITCEHGKGAFKSYQGQGPHHDAVRKVNVPTLTALRFGEDNLRLASK